MRAGIDVLAATVGRKLLVLGDMGEIGEMSGQFHDEVGGYAKSQGIDRLFAFGEASALAARNFGSGGQHFARLDERAAPVLALQVAAIATLCGVLAAVAPARRAAQLDPAQAIRL